MFEHSAPMRSIKNTTLFTETDRWKLVREHFERKPWIAPSSPIASSVAATPVLIDMVKLPPVKPPRLVKFLKPFVLKMHFTNKFVSAQVIHTPTATVASSASSQEKEIRPIMENTRDVAAAAKIGKLLGERLLQKEIPAVSVFLKREQKYHGKVKAVIDSIRDAGVKLI